MTDEQAEREDYIRRVVAEAPELDEDAAVELRALIAPAPSRRAS